MSNSLSSIVDKFEKYLQPDNLKKFTVLDWFNIFSTELSQIFTTRPYRLDPKRLYRARFNYGTEYFIHSKELWAPPRKIASQLRCNLKGQSRLYCTLNAATTLFELKPKTDTEMTVMEYKTTGEIAPLGIVGVNDIIKLNSNMIGIFGDHFINSTAESQLLDDILSKIFKFKTGDKDELSSYNLTNAITQIFLNNQKKPPLTDK
jgi:hypothetical protein